ncbi:MAG TPA: glycosyltransferase [Chloroflexia bacterium]|jgi:UDP:flavonoid glycosyltransferase YjiC (YdhE family)
MRVLFTNQPGFGHWNPLVPLAQTLIVAGHEVAFATAPGFSSTIAMNGFQVFSVGADDTPESLRERQERLASSPGVDQAFFIWTELFAGSRARTALPDLIAFCREWHPDVIVRDLTEFASPIAAESLGIPHATVQLAAFRSDLHTAIIPPLNHLRGMAGLPPEPGYDWLFRYLLLTQFPPGYQDPAMPLPPTTHYIRHTGFDGSSMGQLPAWVGSLPDRPTIYATLGTVFTQMRDVYRAIIDAFAAEPVNLILTTGDLPATEFGTQPPHVHIERYIPQNLLLPHCDLVITHGGSGTVKDALSHGLPMVVIPIAADQHANARRCTHLGVARAIPPDRRTPETIRAAALDVLQDPSYGQNARRIQAEMQSLPTLNEAVTLLERLAATRS